MSDDVFSEVRAASPQAEDDPGDDPFTSVRNTKPDTSTAKPAAPMDNSWLGAAKGVGQAALAVGAGGLKAINLAANDILPGPDLKPVIDKDPVMNYQGGPEAQPILKALQTITSPISSVLGAAKQGIADVAGKRTADVVGDLATLAPGMRGIRAPLADASAIEEGHPLTQAAQAETGRLSSLKDRATSLGLDLPESGSRERLNQASGNNTPTVRAIVRKDLDLPANTPLTQDMFEGKGGVFDTKVTPAYDAVRNDPNPITLDGKYASSQVELLKKARAQFDPDMAPPAGGQISGIDAVQHSQDMRTEARYLYKKAEGPMGSTADLRQANLYKQAAENLEDAIDRHYTSIGKPQVGANWDAARTYAAKANDYMDAMDGAGNINPTVLKNKLVRQGKPLSGDQKMLATIAAQYPEALKITRETSAQPGLIRRAAGAAAPVVGAGVGGWLGGPLGAASGTAAGQHVANKLAGQ